MKITESKAKKYHRSKIKTAEKIAKNPAMAAKVLKDAEKKIKHAPTPLKKLVDDIKKLISLVSDYYSGNYKDISIASVVMIIGAVIYFVSPIDAIPDFVISLGYIDDAAVFTLVLKTLSVELEKYNQWKLKQIQK